MENDFERNKGKLEELMELFSDQCRRRGMGVFHPDVCKFHRQIEQKYPDREDRECLLWHLIIGSTPPDDLNTLDLPNGEIENFIRNNQEI